MEGINKQGCGWRPAGAYLVLHVWVTNYKTIFGPTGHSFGIFLRHLIIITGSLQAYNHKQFHVYQPTSFCCSFYWTSESVGGYNLHFPISSLPAQQGSWGPVHLQEFPEPVPSRPWVPLGTQIAKTSIQKNSWIYLPAAIIPPPASWHGHRLTRFLIPNISEAPGKENAAI